jgi:hypothetical protein
MPVINTFLPNGQNIDCSIILILCNEEQLHRVEDQRVPLMVIFQMDTTASYQGPGDVINLLSSGDELPISHTVLSLHTSCLDATVTSLKNDGLLLVNQSNALKPFYIPPDKIHVPYYLRDAAISEVLVIYGTTNGEQGFYYSSDPAFENICGSMQVCRDVQIDYLASPNHPWASVLRKSKTAFGTCYELFTVHGNITLRAGKGGGMMVSIKGTRDVTKIYNTLGVIMGQRFMHMCMGIEDLEMDGVCNTSEGFFNVHMAVITSCVGKRMSVFSGCVLERLLTNLLGSDGISIIPGISEETNSLKLSILSWERVVRSVYAFSHDRDIDYMADVGQLGDIGDNTISVTSKGCVIVRFSWKDAISWDSKLEKTLVSMCKVLNSLIRECC